LSCLISGGFQIPLEGNARQRAIPAEILRADVHQQRAVDVLFVTGKFAHAVGHHPVFLRRGGHHLSAGADAEGEHAPAIGQMAAQLIGGGRQAGVSGVLFVLGGVAIGLPLLDADAHGEGLGLHGDAPAVEQLKGVPGGVTGAEDQLAAGQRVSPLRAGDGDTMQGPVPDV